MGNSAATQWVIDSNVVGKMWNGRSDAIEIDVISSGVTLDILRGAVEDAAKLQAEPHAYSISIGDGLLSVPKHHSLAVACKRNELTAVAKVMRCRSLVATVSFGGSDVLRLQATEVGGKISALLNLAEGKQALVRSFMNAIDARKFEAAMAAMPAPKELPPAEAGDDEDDAHTRPTWRPSDMPVSASGTSDFPRIKTMRPPCFDHTQGYVTIAHAGH